MKIKLIILLLIPILLINCKEEDDGLNYVGVWVGSTQKVTECMDEEDNGSNELTCDDNTCYRLTLNGDDTFTFQQGLPTLSGTWSVTETTLTLCTLEDGETECLFYDTVLGSRLEMSISNENTGCITSITFERETGI